MAIPMRKHNILRLVGTAPSLRSTALPLPFMAQRFASTTTTISPEQNIAILNDQRLKRPMSPHLTIYQAQLTSGLSIFNRITGSALSVGLYAGAIAYLLHPVFPVIDSAHLIDLVHNLPNWLKISGKFVLAAPFTFHTFNGIRHLTWDMNKALSLKSVYATGYAVLGATLVSSIYLAVM